MKWVDLTDLINTGEFKLRQVGIGGTGEGRDGHMSAFAINAWMYFVVVGVLDSVTNETRYYGFEGATLFEDMLNAGDIEKVSKAPEPIDG